MCCKWNLFFACKNTAPTMSLVSKRLMMSALALLLAGQCGWCAFDAQPVSAAADSAFVGTGMALPDTPKLGTAPETVRPRPDSATTTAALKAQNRRLGWFSIGTAVAGLGSVAIFGLMPFLLLPAAALLGFTVMKRAKKWKKDKDSGYWLGLIGVVVSLAFLGLVAVLVASN